MLLTNGLAVVTRRDWPRPLRNLGDLGGQDVRRIAIGDPAAVPAGVYARQALERAGVWSLVQPRLVPTVSVRAALAAADEGNADAAIVYRTDVAAARHARLAFVVSAGDAPPIVYPAAVMTRSAEPRGGACVARVAPRAVRPRDVRAAWLRSALADAMTAEHLQIIRFTVLVAVAATVLMLPPGVALAWLLARGRFRGKALLETLVTLPLVLPPVATGFILLRLLGRRGPFGAMLERGGIDLIFTWKAVLLAMAVMGLPLVVRTARAGFEQITRRYEQMAETLGAGPWRVFLTISLPLASRTVLAGALLGFSRALGEFGATIVIAGNIPGETRTIAVAMFGYLGDRARQ